MLKLYVCMLYAVGLLDRYTSLLPDVQVPFGGQTVVVGDTHGQLEDVLTIFLAHGTPSSRNRPCGWPVAACCCLGISSMVTSRIEAESVLSF